MTQERDWPLLSFFKHIVPLDPGAHLGTKTDTKGDCKGVAIIRTHVVAQLIECSAAIFWECQECAHCGIQCVTLEAGGSQLSQRLLDNLQTIQGASTTTRWYGVMSLCSMFTPNSFL